MKLKMNPEIKLLQSLPTWKDIDDQVQSALMRAAQACWNKDDTEKVFTFLSDNLITDDRIMKEYDAGRAVGLDTARRQIVAMIRDDAAKYFLKNDDEQADRYRDLAAKIEKEIT